MKNFNLISKNVLLATCVALSSQAFLEDVKANASINIGYDDSNSSSSFSSSKNNSKMSTIKKPSQEEIMAEYKRLNIANLVTNEFKTQPNFTSGSYHSGALTDETLNNALTVYNYVRFLAGIDDNVTLNRNYNQYAQDASLINALNGSLSHYPSKPSEVSQSLFDSGYKGSSKSNLGSGGKDLKYDIIHMFMNDSDSSNIDRVGHRRHILRSTAKQVGFGLINNENSKYKQYSALYCVDDSYFDDSKISGGITWPAHNMPMEFFKSYYAWSYSINNDSITHIDSVTLTKNNGEQVWNLSHSNSGQGANYFNIDNSNYGDDGCVIFRADGLTYANGDTFLVELKSGSRVVDSYDVNFFYAEPLSSYMIEDNFPEEGFAQHIGVHKNILSVKLNDDNNTGEVSYQWYANDIEISEDSTDKDYRYLAQILGKVDYKCKITRDNESIFSDTVTVTVKHTPVTMSDIDDHWAKDSIEYVTNKNWIRMDYSTKYKPNDPVIRLEFVLALGSMELVDVNLYQDRKFVDSLETYEYYQSYIDWANKKGIISGITETTFAPYDSITREQMALILSNYLKAMGYNVNKTVEKVIFADDAKISHWAKEAVYEIQQLGILSGKSNNMFDPKGTATRAEFAVLLKLIAETDGVNLPQL